MFGQVNGQRRFPGGGGAGNNDQVFSFFLDGNAKLIT